MKLKKIVSLTLAGVLAVSMLAGCSTNKNDNNKDEGGADKTGYSSVLASNLPDVAKLDYVTFADNAEDVAALKDALGNLGSVTTGGSSILPTLICLDGPNGIEGLNKLTGLDLMIADFVDNADLMILDTIGNDPIDEDSLSFTSIQNKNANVVCKAGTLYAIDGMVDVNKAVKQVAESLEDILSQLPEDNGDTTLSYDYKYTVSVSVVNKPLTVIDGYHAAGNFIAVTVTRTGTAA